MIKFDNVRVMKRGTKVRPITDKDVVSYNKSRLAIADKSRRKKAPPVTLAKVNIKDVDEV